MHSGGTPLWKGQLSNLKRGTFYTNLWKVGSMCPLCLPTAPTFVTKEGLCERNPASNALFTCLSFTCNFLTFSRFNTDLVQRVKKQIREELSARHVPEVILPIDDIPYTTSGKKVEVAVKRILAGEHITRRGSFTNPSSLDLYYGILDNNEKQ